MTQAPTPPNTKKPLPPDPRGPRAGNKQWTLRQLLSYEPVQEALEGQRTLTEIAESYDALSQAQLSRLLEYVGRFDRNLLPAKLRKRARRGTKQVVTYPVYGRVQAGDFNGSDQITFNPDDEMGESYYTGTAIPEGDREAFVLEVRGDSMTDGSASVDFPEGSKVLINPNIQPEASDFVVVFDLQASTATLKKFQPMNGVEWLVPLNPDWKPFQRDPENHVYVGVVEEAMKPLYRRQDGVKRRRRQP